MLFDKFHILLIIRVKLNCARCGTLSLDGLVLSYKTSNVSISHGKMQGVSSYIKLRQISAHFGFVREIRGNINFLAETHKITHLGVPMSH